MRVYAVQISQTRQATVRIPAASPQAARVAADFMLKPGDAIRGITELRDVSPCSGRAALNHLLAREYLEMNGKPMLVEDWLQAARHAKVDPDTERLINAKLALAALRVDASTGRVAIGSATRSPVLHGWFLGTPWEDTGLIRALSAVPGAQRSLLTFAGLRSRVVTLPLDSVLHEVAQ